jgi:hypothetical protein
MTEDACAENNFNPFAANFDVVPIPQASRPDF